MDRIDYLVQRYLQRKETEAELAELIELVGSGQYPETIEDRFAKGRKTCKPEIENCNEDYSGDIGDHAEVTTYHEVNAMPAKTPRLCKAAALLLLLLIVILLSVLSFTVLQYAV